MNVVDAGHNSPLLNSFFCGLKIQATLRIINFLSLVKNILYPRILIKRNWREDFLDARECFFPLAGQREFAKVKEDSRMEWRRR
jgi:hypothetical protein